ncbi:helix-turn-helix protein [compost metagenome]
MLQISLAAARVNAEMSQQEAAVEVGVTAKTLRNYEHGKTAIPGRVLRRLSFVYRCPEEYIRLPIVDDGEYDEDEKNLP